MAKSGYQRIKEYRARQSSGEQLPTSKICDLRFSSQEWRGCANETLLLTEQWQRRANALLASLSPD